MDTWTFVREGFPTFVLKAEDKMDAVRIVSDYIRADKRIGMKVAHLKDYSIDILNDFMCIKGDMDDGR